MKVITNKKYNFLQITPDKGNVLTDWDKKDIKNYSSSTLMYTPLSYDHTKLYEITVAEDEANKEQQRKAFEEEEIKREKIER